MKRKQLAVAADHCIEILLSFLLVLPNHHHHQPVERFGVAGTFRGHVVQPPCSEQGLLQPDQAAESPVQPGLEWFQGWGISHTSGQLVPIFHSPPLV